MRYHVLLECDRPHPLHFAAIETDDDDQALRLLAEKWPGEDDLLPVRQGGRRLVTMRRS